MADREKVIKWLAEEAMEHEEEEVRDLAHTALLMLKEQEPKVMTLEEIEDCDSAMWIEFKSSIYPAIYHDRHGKWLFITRKSQCWLGAEKHYADNYNKTWRCWNIRPSDEQRKAVPWDD